MFVYYEACLLSKVGLSLVRVFQNTQKREYKWMEFPVTESKACQHNMQVWRPAVYINMPRTSVYMWVFCIPLVERGWALVISSSWLGLWLGELPLEIHKLSITLHTTQTLTTLLVYVVMTAIQNVKEHIDLLQKKSTLLLSSSFRSDAICKPLQSINVQLRVFTKFMNPPSVR